MILFDNEVVDYLDNLVFELYKKEYFGFVESADAFVLKLADFIYENIEKLPSRKTPSKIQQLGSNYIFYQSNQRTTWYVFFDKEGTNYLITSIINNHSKEAKWLL